MRIAKYIAASGLCSRRKAEEWIAERRVVVDGQCLNSPAFNVPEGAVVEVDGKRLTVQEETPRLWLLHKPADCITSHHDPEGRKTVFAYIPKELGRVLTIGRLDFNTEGLLLLTNNGDLANRLTHPSLGWERTYRVRVFGHVEEAKLKGLSKGVTLTNDKGQKVSYGPVKASVEDAKNTGRNRWIRMTITEGKNREIRNICAHLGLEVNRLVRVEYGPFTLAGLERGEVMEVPHHRVQKMLKTTGLKKP